MNSIKSFGERFEALEQQTEPWKQQTRMGEQRRRGWHLTWRVAAMAVLGLALARPYVVQAKIFHCSAGDVQCLIAAINTANANGTENTIRLETGTYTLTAPDNDSNGLPVIISTLTITGQGAETTIIERDTSLLGFRILQVAANGNLTLKRLTLRRGFSLGSGGGIFNQGTLALTHTTVTLNSSSPGDGGGIFNQGTLTLAHTTVAQNFGFEGGGIWNEGTLTLAHSLIAENDALGGGGLLCSGPSLVTLAATTVTRNIADIGGGIIIRKDFPSEGAPFVIITESAITSNSVFRNGFGGGILNGGGTVVITNTTIAANTDTVFCFFPFFCDGGAGIALFGGTLFLLNSTVADNAGLGLSGGIHNGGGTVLLQNTLVARNDAAHGTDCSGIITSLGTNLIGDPTGCTITLQPTDLTGDPGLDTFTDDGTPGNGHFPLLSTSQAIDAGSDAVCPRTDQLGQRRIGPCDIGAIRFLDNSDLLHKDPATAAQASR